MNPTKETAPLNPEEPTNGGNGSIARDSSECNNSTTLKADNPNDSNPDWNVDYIPRTKRHKQKSNEMPTRDQAGAEAKCPPEEAPPQKNPSQCPPPAETKTEPRRHLPGEKANSNLAENSRVKTEPPPRAASVIQPSVRLSTKIKKDNLMPVSSDGNMEVLKKQNVQLLEALMRLQKTHATDKKRFHEVLFGIDKALSSLPIRLEKIRVRNQKNLSMIKTSRFYRGDGNENENATEDSTCDSSPSSDSLTLTSQDGHSHVSFRMRSLLQKIDQLNVLVRNIQEGDSSPIELLVNSELYAISLLKKEIKSTKKKIDDNRTDTDTARSFEESPKAPVEEFFVAVMGQHPAKHKPVVPQEKQNKSNSKSEKDLTYRGEECPGKAKNSFSNELNKASNFKIFENHMMLQEEALNLLTRKIKETEDALSKEIEAKECLKRENEIMAKEIFRLKSGGEEYREEKFLKTEKLKLEHETTTNRPYRLIKELRVKLEEKEKALIASKSKCIRMETASANKTSLLEGEKKKTTQLEGTIKNLRTQNKTLSAHVNSLKFLNEQLKEQLQILKHQVEILACQRLQDMNVNSKDLKLIDWTRDAPRYEDKVKEIEKEAESKVEEVKSYYEGQLEEIQFQLQRHQGKNEEYADTFKELLIIINNFGMEKDMKNIRTPTYNRIREILHITPSDLELLFSVYAKSSAEKEIEKLFEDFRAIVDGEENEFSETLSAWFFDIILDKMFRWGSDEKLSQIILT